MRIGIIADIHSNLTALQAVLADLAKQGGADEFWCLGDIVGYGPDPHECLEIVRTRFNLCVAGNHDLAAAGKMDTNDFNQDAARAARWTGLKLDNDEVHFLSSLPLKAEKGDFTLVHGSPRDPVREYILTDREAEENLSFFKTRLCLIGHSHTTMYFTCSESCSSDRPGARGSLKLVGHRYIINPGGVGQPRDGDPRAAYAVYDSETAVLVFHRVSYDIPAVQARMRKVGLPLWLMERLENGR